MKILLTGSSGMLAQAIKQEFKNETLILSDVQPQDKTTIQLDITNPSQVDQVITKLKPDFIINCAAYTAVDAAEDNPELAEKINALGPENLAKSAEKIGATLVHISTDYIFGGQKPLAEAYAEDDEKRPETVYGKTKLKGEQNIVKNTSHYYIFRTAWLYGPGGKNFVDTMLNLAKTNSELKVVNDQHGSPTSAKTLTRIIRSAINQKVPYGVYHATNDGFTTWYDFTKLIFKYAKSFTPSLKIPKITPVSSAEYPTKAHRPHNSKLSKEKLKSQNIKIPGYKSALLEYLQKS